MVKNDENLEDNVKLKTEQLKELQQYVIHMIDNEENIIETFDSIVEICKKYNLDNSCVSKVLKGKRKHIKGFKFKKEYVEL